MNEKRIPKTKVGQFRDYSGVADLSEDHRTINTLAQPIHIVLTKNSKGYTYEVSVHAETLERTIELVDQANEHMKRNYGGGTE